MRDIPEVPMEFLREKIKEYIIKYDDIETTAILCGIFMEFAYRFKYDRSLLLDIVDYVLNVIRNILR